MAIYKFRVSFEDYDDVTREIEIKSNQTFADFHQAIHKAIGFDGKAAASFYMSNDQWHKGKEITLYPESISSEKVALMENAILKNFIVDPHQKIYYVFNFDRPWIFFIQMIKISINEDAKLTYPLCVKSVGDAPKQFGNTPIVSNDKEDLDFLNVLEYGEDDEEREDMGFDEGSEEEENKEEFGSEFDEEFKD